MEGDEVYLVAGHKDHPEIVGKLGRKGRRRRLKGARGRGTLDKEKPPIFGLFQRKGDVAIQILPNVQQATIQPVITRIVKPESRLYTDEYNIYRCVTDWAMSTSPSIIHKVNMPAMTMGMVSMKFTSTL